MLKSETTFFLRFYNPLYSLYYQAFLPMKIFKKLLGVFAVSLLIFSTSCVETVVVGSVVGGALVTREKSLNNTRHDIMISTTLGADFIANGLKNPGNSIDITVNEGRVLLTGIARDPQKAKLAQKLAWNVKDVREVIDEIQIREDGKFYARDVTVASRDYAITGEIETKILFGKNISSMNYQVTTVAGTVYLLGVADDESEMRHVLSIVSKVRGVDKVVNHVILENDSRRRG